MPLELPDDLKNDPSLKDFNDFPSLAKAYKDTKALVGSSIRPPGPDASPEQKKEFREKLKKHAPELIEFPEDEKAREEVEADIYKRLGVPEKAEEYTVKDAPEGLDLAPLREHAKKVGLTRKQFDKLAQEAIQAHAAMSEAGKAQEAALRKEWGQAFEERAAAARAIAVKLGVPAADAAKMPMSQLPVWFNVAKSMGAPTAEGGRQDSTTPPKLSPNEAILQMDEIRARLLDPKLDRNVRKALLEKQEKLAEAAFAE